ncbi:MAG: aminoacyl-tRNA hydrolase [Thelocarpon impressellum]|nr:MAG: aminoacyl-tRNA hydrolase [Thelocarpon impressellum]
MTPPRLLIVSIGNPPPHLHTLHSAAHLVLSALRTSLAFPPPLNSRALGNGLVSEAPHHEREAERGWTLWQSMGVMNVSGRGVGEAWRVWARAAAVHDGEEGRGRKLVVLHDDLEEPLGRVKVKSSTSSARGHNGLRSIAAALSPKGVPYSRIGIGVGRPQSRERGDAAEWLLRKVTPAEKAVLEGEEVVGSVLRALREIS